MLSELYVEALLIDAESADQVWELWDVGLITKDLAALAQTTLTIRAGGDLDEEI